MADRVTAAADLATVVALAALTTDRTRAEQAALERVAAGLDAERNLMTVTNPRVEWLHLDDTVPCTYYPGPPDTHPSTDRKAKAAGLPRACKCDDTGYNAGRVRRFSAAAKAEALTDDNGWSRALDAVKSESSGAVIETEFSLSAAPSLFDSEAS